ncbi:interleukin-34-like [Xyrauchen texanus]|uniref:interleukin-34-like n=1 Tax=Xyrauchen texanus TaxID=154827 RepID=UPI0022419D51|nr:interleukin-34-like [Xyrauchen texanus]
MSQSECQLLRVLLGSICVLLMCMSAAPDLCGPLKTVRDSLNSTLRRRYMKMNFPINYTIQVHYEEVYRLRNISRLRNESRVELRDLQDLWLLVSQQGIKRILKVLPERHPTRRKYLSNLENLFRDFQVQYSQQNPSHEERDLPDSIQNISDNLRDPYYQGWKSVTPKSLLDNCYRSMLCLFKDCFSTDDDSYDYCEVLNRRKEKKTT